ncbi:unnamed protein product [Ixodes hexagonus]
MEATTSRSTPSDCCPVSPSMVAQGHVEATTSRSTPSDCCPVSPSMVAQGHMGGTTSSSMPLDFCPVTLSMCASTEPDEACKCLIYFAHTPAPTTGTNKNNFCPGG